MQESWHRSACLLRDGGRSNLHPNATEPRYEPTFYTSVALTRLDGLLRTEREAPFLLFLSLRPPHAPYEPSPLEPPSTPRRYLEPESYIRRLQGRYREGSGKSLCHTFGELRSSSR